jgi:Chlorophyll A-B binding protein
LHGAHAALCCSFAMLGAAGVVIPGLLSKVGILSVPDWYVAGEIAIKDSGIPLGALISVQMFLMGWAEASRFQVLHPSLYGVQVCTL